jgi:hypothetical protein
METETSAPGEQPKFLGVRCVKSRENGSTEHTAHASVLSSIKKWVNLEDGGLVMINLFLNFLFQKRVTFYQRVFNNS